MNLYLPQWCLIMFASGLVYTLPDVSMFACPGAINDDTPAKSMHCTGCAGVAQCIKMEVTQKQGKQTRILYSLYMCTSSAQFSTLNLSE